MDNYKPRVKVNSNGPKVDEGAAEHDPDLYSSAVVAKPVAGGLSYVTDEHLAFYRQEGYLAVENVFSSNDVATAKEALLDLIMGRIPSFKSIIFEAKAADKLNSLSVDERQDAVRRLAWFMDHEPRLKALALQPSLMEFLVRILGESPNLVQDMALIKPPYVGREKPWHQDHAYFNIALGNPVVGVWIALDEATIDNGCMHVQPQGHRHGPVLHFRKRDWQICDTDIMGKPCVAVPLKPGSALFFDSLLPHGTPTNHSPKRRKALQLHYAAKSAIFCSEEDRLSVFGSEGKNAEC